MKYIYKKRHGIEIFKDCRIRKIFRDCRIRKIFNYIGKKVVPCGLMIFFFFSFSFLSEAEGLYLSGQKSSAENEIFIQDPEEQLTEEEEKAEYDISGIFLYTGASYDALKAFTDESEYTTLKRQKLLLDAIKYIGNPYVYGGTDLEKGCDCSAFIQGVFGHFGISTGRSSRDQFRNSLWLKGEEVMPGDLIFYADNGYINHVALYAGNELIIHAANRKTGIKVSRYDYRTPYAYGRLLFE